MLIKKRKLKKYYDSKIDWFEFLELENGEEIIEEEYMKFHDWCVQFEELINLLKQRCKKLEICEENLIKTIYKD